jgi:protein TonB
VYPQASRNYGSEGTVKLQFTIEKDGKLDDVKVVQSSGDQFLDDEAFRVVSSSPDWQPGALHGKPVKVTYTFPVIFQLQNKTKKENSHPSGWSTGR